MSLQFLLVRIHNVCRVKYPPLEGSAGAKITMLAGIIVKDLHKIVKNAFDFDRKRVKQKFLCQIAVSTSCIKYVLEKAVLAAGRRRFLHIFCGAKCFELEFTKILSLRWQVM